MSCEGGRTPEEPKPQVDVHRANRELERWLFGDRLFEGQSLDAPREDQHGTYFGEGWPSRSEPLPSNWRDNAELVMVEITTIERDDQGKIVNIHSRWERPDGTPIKFDSEK